MNPRRHRLQILLFLLHNICIIECIPAVTLIPTQCGTTQPPSTGQIIQSVATVDGNHSEPVNCTITMTATSSAYRIRFGFNTGHGDVGLVNSPNSTACDGASVELFDGPSTTSTSLTGKFCGSLTSAERLSSGNTMTMLVLSSGDNDTVLNFTAHYTSFKEGPCGSDFECKNTRCISPAMKCDTTLINNCGDFSDNSPGRPANCTSEPETTQPAAIMSTTIPGNMTAQPTTDTTSDLLWIAYGVAAVVGVYCLHWLLFRPGWLVWRMGCFRHLRCCRNCGGGSSAKNSVDAAKPLTSNMHDIGSSKNTEKIAGDRTTYSSSEVRQTRITSSAGNSPMFLQRIKREQHIFSVHG